MAVIASSGKVKDSASNGALNLTRTALSASDTLTYLPGGGQVLVLFNTTGSVVNVTLVGTAPTTLYPAGFGGAVSTASGKQVAVPANGCTYLELDDISAFLSGTGVVTVTGGTGVSAVLYA